eukprot:s3587_g9.t1
MPLALSDLGAQYYPKLFCTDASSYKGAIVWADAPRRLITTLWKTSASKGSYTRILSPAEVVLRNNGMLQEEKLSTHVSAEPERPLAYHFDFIEVFSGASLISDRLSSLGYVVGPPLDIGISSEYNLAFPHVMQWLTYLLSAKKLKSVMVSPPCTTFSIMRRPRLRSAEQPYGFQPREEKTQTGNLLGQRGAQVLTVAAVNGAAGTMETTYSSYLKHLPGWKSVKRMDCAEEVRCDSCAFGSPHLKPFRFLSVHMSLRRVSKRCTCSHKHLRVEGTLTKASATYVDALVEALALSFAEAIDQVKQRRHDELEVDISGLESQLVNEAALSSKWSVHSSWTYKKQSHINILEEAALLRLANFLSRDRKPLRVVAMVDSFVVRGATSKGRTSSRGLSAILRRVNAICIAAALYFTLPFVPTRLNPADDPTRDVPLRLPVAGLNLDSERLKASQRLLRPPVPPGRPVLPQTQAKRIQYLDEFFIWATGEGVDVITLFERHMTFIDDINILLERYGRALYNAGKSYGRYAETINAITSWKPPLRRLLQGAWDCGYAWMKHEPSTHHSAMPGPIALAILATSILWGWTQFAGVIALMWAGLLRPGELLSATRADLLLPSDGDMTMPFGLLAIREPKTRFTNARHQSAKVDMPDMLRIIEMFLGPLAPHQRLWPMSGSTLRSRFRQVLAALQLPLQTYNGARPLELASIRAGAATWMMQVLENGDLLQRRGRWANKKMMEIYVQEISALTYLTKVPQASKDRVLAVAGSFLNVLNKAEVFLLAKIPPRSWPILFQV